MSFLHSVGFSPVLCTVAFNWATTLSRLSRLWGWQILPKVSPYQVVTRLKPTAQVLTRLSIHCPGLKQVTHCPVLNQLIHNPSFEQVVSDAG